MGDLGLPVAAGSGAASPSINACALLRFSIPLHRRVSFGLESEWGLAGGTWLACHGEVWVFSLLK